jgi:hypothetical protein
MGFSGIGNPSSENAPLLGIFLVVVLLLLRLGWVWVHAGVGAQVHLTAAKKPNANAAESVCGRYDDALPGTR